MCNILPDLFLKSPTLIRHFEIKFQKAECSAVFRAHKSQFEIMAIVSLEDRTDETWFRNNFWNFNWTSDLLRLR